MPSHHGTKKSVRYFIYCTYCLVAVFFLVGCAVVYDPQYFQGPIAAKDFPVPSGIYVDINKEGGGEMIQVATTSNGILRLVRSWLNSTSATRCEVYGVETYEIYRLGTSDVFLACDLEPDKNLPASATRAGFLICAGMEDGLAWYEEPGKDFHDAIISFENPAFARIETTEGHLFRIVGSATLAAIQAKNGLRDFGGGISHLLHPVTTSLFPRQTRWPRALEEKNFPPPSEQDNLKNWLNEVMPKSATLSIPYKPDHPIPSR